MSSDRKFILQSIARNDREETFWTDWLQRADAIHLCDILRDLAIAEKTLADGTSAAMLDDINFVCMQPISVAAQRLAFGVALHRVRAELIRRVEEGDIPSKGPSA